MILPFVIMYLTDPARMIKIAAGITAKTPLKKVFSVKDKFLLINKPAVMPPIRKVMLINIIVGISNSKISWARDARTINDNNTMKMVI